MPDQVTIINRSNIAWLLVIIAALWIIFSQWKSCGAQRQADQQYAQLQQRNDSVEADRARTKIEKTRDSIILTTKLNATVADRDHHVHGEDSIKTVLNTLQKNNKGLPGRILEYVNITDTAFQRKCDSAARALLAASKSYDDLKMEDSLTKALYEYEIKIRNQYTADVQKYLDSCNAQSYRQSELFNKAMSMGKPRGSLIGGVSGEYSPSYGQGGIWMMYRDKDGRYYGGGTGYNSFNKMYFEGRIGITIFGKK